MLLPSCCALLVLKRVTSNIGSVQVARVRVVVQRTAQLKMRLLPKVSGAPIWLV